MYKICSILVFLAYSFIQEGFYKSWPWVGGPIMIRCSAMQAAKAVCKAAQEYHRTSQMCDMFTRCICAASV